MRANKWGKYRARILVKGRYKYVGVFATELEAVEAQNKARIELAEDLTESIKDICFKCFKNGLTRKQIVTRYAFKFLTVKFYENKYNNEVLNAKFYNSTYDYDKALEKIITKMHVLPDHQHEMDYGTALPTYTWQSLSPRERGLALTKRHKRLRHLN